MSAEIGTQICLEHVRLGWGPPSPLNRTVAVTGVLLFPPQSPFHRRTLVRA